MAPNILSDDNRWRLEIGLTLAPHLWQGLKELDNKRKCLALIFLHFKPHCYALWSFNNA